MCSLKHIVLRRTGHGAIGSDFRLYFRICIESMDGSMARCVAKNYFGERHAEATLHCDLKHRKF